MTLAIRLGRGGLLDGAMHALVLWLYVWFATAGTFSLAEQPPARYDLLADAFLAGQLHLPVAPHPALLQMENPYDPARHTGLNLVDASLFNGRYYLYYGPVPGLIHAAWKGATGLPGSEAVVDVAFGYLGVLAFWLIARQMRARAFPGVGDGSVRCATLSVALGGVSTHLQARPSFYHEAVTVGAGLAFVALLCWLRGTVQLGKRNASLAAAGLLFGLAVGARPTASMYAFGAVLALVALAWRERADRQRIGLALGAFIVPLALVGASLGAYNVARFGSPFETGLRYALTGPYPLVAYDPRLIPGNLATYALYWPDVIPFFPFQTSYTQTQQTSFGVDRIIEASFTSVLLVAPTLALLPVMLVPLIRNTWRRSAAVGGLLVAASVGLMGNLATALGLTWVTARFTEDFLIGGLILGCAALWSLRPAVSRASAALLGYRLLGYRLLVAVTTTLALAAGLSLGLSEVSIRAPRQALPIAYAFDRAELAALRAFGLSSWSTLYQAGSTARRPFGDGGAQPPAERPNGTFVVKDAAVVLPPLAGRAIDRLNVDSVAPAPIGVSVEVDGEVVSGGVVYPGRQYLCWEGGRVRDEPAAVSLRLDSRDARAASLLWPIRVRGFESSAGRARFAQELTGSGLASIEADLCNFAVAWRSADGAPVRVWVTNDVIPPTQYWVGPSERHEFPWIETSQATTFMVYDMTSMERPLATARVWRLP